MDPHEQQTPTARASELEDHFEQVAAALSPLRDSSRRSTLAQAVARLVTDVAVACRVDVREDRDPDDFVTLSRVVRGDRADLASPEQDLGDDEARAGKTAIIPDPDRDLSWVVIPLVVNQESKGALRVVLDGRANPAPAELAHLYHIASSLSMGLSSAELHEQSERVSRRLQESLLPHELPTGPWFQVAGRYVPATAGMHVGGDWYDAQLMAPDELAFSVGDVAGHGVEAAARMGELRTASRAFRMLSRAPDDLIALLHQVSEPAGYLATGLCGRLDPSGGFRWASAGHLPPMLAHSSGEVESLAGSLSPPFGAGLEGSVGLNQRALRPGDMVLLYTDGLIERRDESLDVSIDRLAAQLTSLLDATPRPDPDNVLEALLESRQASGPMGDDVAVIAVRLTTRD